MNSKTQAKLEQIVADYHNGNLSTAAAAIRRLTKAQLVELLTNPHQLILVYLTADRRYDFERFMLRSLQGYHQ